MRKLTKLSEVTELRNAGKSHWAAFHGNCVDVDSYYLRTFTIPKHKNVEAYKSLIAKNKVDIMAVHIGSIGRRVVIHPWKNTQKVSEIVGALKRFGEMTLLQAQRSGQVDPIAAMTKHVCLYDAYCLDGPRYVTDRFPLRPSTIGITKEQEKETLDKWERQREEARPFCFTARNPQNVITDPWSDEPEWHILEYQRRAGDVAAHWPNWNAKNSKWWQVWQNGNPEWRSVKWTEFWSKYQHCAMANDIPVTDGIEDNPYGYDPIQVGFGGKGFESADGSPEQRAESMVYTIMHAIRAESQLKTGMIDHAIRFMSGERSTVLPQHEDFQPATVPGEVGTIPKQYEYQIHYPSPLNPDTYRIVPMLGQDMDSATFSPVMEGRQPNGAAPQSGYDRAQMSAHDRVRSLGAVQSIEKTLGKALMMAGQCVRDCIREPVTLWDIQTGRGAESETVKPSYFDTDPVFEVRLDGKTPEERQRTLEIMEKLCLDNFISWETAIRESTDYDPEQERILLMKEKVIRESPEIQQAMAVAMLKSYGLDQEAEALRAAAASKPRTVPSGGFGGTAQQNRLTPELTAELQRLGTMGKPAQLGSPQERVLMSAPGAPSEVVP